MLRVGLEGIAGEIQHVVQSQNLNQSTVSCYSLDWWNLWIPWIPYGFVGFLRWHSGDFHYLHVARRTWGYCRGHTACRAVAQFQSTDCILLFLGLMKSVNSLDSARIRRILEIAGFCRSLAFWRFPLPSCCASDLRVLQAKYRMSCSRTIPINRLYLAILNIDEICEFLGFRTAS